MLRDLMYMSIYVREFCTNLHANSTEMNKNGKQKGQVEVPKGTSTVDKLA